MTLKKMFNVGLIVVIFKQLFAYLDPGSGSLIIQVVLAVLLGITATFHLWKNRVLSLFGRGSSTISSEENEDYESMDNE